MSRTVSCTASELRIRTLPIIAVRTDTSRRILRGEVAVTHVESFDGKWLFVEAPAGIGWASAEYLRSDVIPPEPKPAGGRADIVARARSAIGLRIDYKLGKGGMNPATKSPASNGECDCSGFSSWCIGLSRQTKDPFYVALNGGWLETTAMTADALRTGGILTKVDTPQPGDLIVYGDRVVNGRRSQGHVGIVSEVRDGKASKVIHCSSGNARRVPGRAVQETSPSLFFNAGAIYARVL
jgi:cell wall-associated NlpC family hydrolase